jgi:hypothetical protein
VGVLKVMAVDFFLWVSRRSSGMVDYRELYPFRGRCIWWWTCLVTDRASVDVPQLAASHSAYTFRFGGWTSFIHSFLVLIWSKEIYTIPKVDAMHEFTYVGVLGSWLR